MYELLTPYLYILYGIDLWIFFKKYIKIKKIEKKLKKNKKIKKILKKFWWVEFSSIDLSYGGCILLLLEFKIRIK